MFKVCQTMAAKMTPQQATLMALLAGAALAAPSVSGATNLGTIMPLGDSITDGVGSSAGGGYRDPLYTDLTNAGYSFTYVGSATDNSTAKLDAAGQNHHEGHSGYVIQQRDPSDPNASGSGRAGILDNINSYLSGVSPNYILLMIGTNDVNLNYYPGNPMGSEQGARLSALISAISDKSTGLDPSAHLIVAQITPTEDPGENVRTEQYNQYVASVVGQHQSMGENVTLVDMYDALNPATDLNDTLHPNDSGYAKMATVWLNGIEAVPEPMSLPIVALAGACCLLRRARRQTAA